MDQAYSVSSVYLPSYILHSLQFVNSTVVSLVRSKIVEFLTMQKESGGIWRFFGKNNPFPPPDFDDTCCVLASLKENSINIDTDVHELLSKCKSETGLYYTWIDDKMNKESHYSTDGGVNSNILFFGALIGLKFPEIIRLINLYSSSQNFRDFSAWSVSEYSSMYLVTRLYRDGKVAEIEPANKKIIQILKDSQCPDGSWGNSLDTVFALLSLANADGNKETILKAINHLLSLQKDSGDFGLIAAFRDFAPTYYGSPYFTTALFAEAIAKVIGKKAKNGWDTT